MARILAARNGRVQNSPPMIKRCWVGGDDPLMLAYHDEEWGVPVRDDRALFGKLVLDGFQGKEAAFAPVLWSLVGDAPKQTRRRPLRGLPARTRQSDAMSEALAARGFRFTGSTICYAFMQAVGMVNDHLVTCFRHAELRVGRP